MQRFSQVRVRVQVCVQVRVRVRLRVQVRVRRLHFATAAVCTCCNSLGHVYFVVWWVCVRLLRCKTQSAHALVVLVVCCRR